VAGAIGLATFLLAWRRDRAGRWEALMLMPLLAMIVFVAVTSARGLGARLLATSGEDARFSVYPAVVDAIGDRPLLGHGLGAFEEAFRPYVPPDAAGAEWAFAHNTFLEVAFGLGLPAAGVFYAAIALIVLRIFRGARTRRRERVYTCFALGCAAAAAFHSVFDFSLQIPAVAALFAAILGLGYAQSFTYEELVASKEGDARPRHSAGRPGPSPGQGADIAGSSSSV
jgi:O-antigen ligase